MSTTKISKKKSMVNNRYDYYYTLIERTSIGCMNLHKKKILTSNELNVIIEQLDLLTKRINHLCVSNRKSSQKESQNEFFSIQNDIKKIIASAGTEKLYDVLSIFFCRDYVKTLDISKSKRDKLNVLLNYTHPYKIDYFENKNDSKLKTGEKTLLSSSNISCFDIIDEYDFYTKVYGIKIVFHYKNSSIVAKCFVNETMLLCSSNMYIKNAMDILKRKRPDDAIFKTNVFNMYIDSICLKAILIHSEKTIYELFLSCLQLLNKIKQKSISHNVRDFLNSTLYEQRAIISVLLIDYEVLESQYMAYLLYDLLSSDNNDVVDTKDQTLLYESLSWTLKKRFRIAMKDTIEYTTKLSNIDNNKIPLEQQICLMKSNDSVKEKAMNKLKEVKSKTEDSGSKARQYLDGLLKIPFKI